MDLPSKQKILIIDDEARLRRSLLLILEVSNYQVTCAENAHDGLQLLQDSRYDLLFLDVKLPDGDGISLLPAILQIHPCRSSSSPLTAGKRRRLKP
jgi:DNA-binding response OmpR family regulator